MSAAHPTPNPKVARLLQEAVALHQGGQLEAAEAAYRRVLKRDPREPNALHLLGVARGQRGDAREGEALIKRAIAVRDNFPAAHMNLALILWRNLGNLVEAEHHVRRALCYQPTPANYDQLGTLLRERGQNEEAMAAFRAAMECAPKNPEGYVIYARALRLTDDATKMLEVAQAGLALAPEHAVLHSIASQAFFALGRLEEGWHAYRWRFRAPENRTPPSPYRVPSWNGEDLTGRTVLIWTEQGPGDEVMYANMFGDVIALARRCIIQCSARLAPLMRRSFPGAEVFDRNLAAHELSGIDFQTPAGSLGEWLRPTLAAFPRVPSYLQADAALREALRTKYKADPTRPLLVGIAWKGPAAPNAAEKSMNLLDWGAVLQVPGITFVNLQYGDCALELQEASKGFGVQIVQDTDIDPLRDIDAHAAQVAAMDLVVTSSNTAAHIAGALGVPTLCMLPSSLGRGRRWYWFAEQSDCPWYPRLRRLIQRRDGDWLDVIRDASLALIDLVSSRGIAVTGFLYAIAKAFADMQRPADAEGYYLRLAAEVGHAAPAYLAIADMKIAALDTEGAFAFLDRAIAADPTFDRAYDTKGLVLARLNRFDEAIAAYRLGLSHNHQSAQLHNNLGIALSKLGRADESLLHLGNALSYANSLDTRSRDAIALNYTGALDAVGQTDEAIVKLDEIIARNPEDVDAHYNKARHLLSAGRLAEGWPEFEWRLQRPNVYPRYDMFPHLKRWRGEGLEGNGVLVWTEQGIGDQILIASMIPDLIGAAQHVVILTTSRLVPLFRRSFPTAVIDEISKPLPRSAHDPRLSFQMSMSDLGRAFRSDLTLFPKRRQYLTADATRSQTLSRKYRALLPGRPLVGISWSSHGNPEIGWLKSNNLAAWGPILQNASVAFVNLQYLDRGGMRASEIAQAQQAFCINIVSDPDVEPLSDIDAFAAQVAAMDLVISTSNTTVHMAGSLGVPTWVLAPTGRGRHWYWFKNRSDSPWYPSLRFVDGDLNNDWGSIIARCADDLGGWAHRHGESANS